MAICYFIDCICCKNIFTEGGQNKLKILPVVERKYTKEAHAISQEPLLKNLVIRQNVNKLQHSRLLNAFRQCNRCPLGAKTKVVMQGKEQTTIVLPAVCSYYVKDNTECPVDKRNYVILLKEYYNVVDQPEYIEDLGKLLMKNALSDASMARDVEVIERGRPGHFTNVHEERAVKVFDSVVKLRTGGGKHLHLHGADEEVIKQTRDEAIAEFIKGQQVIDVKEVKDEQQQTNG